MNNLILNSLKVTAFVVIASIFNNSANASGTSLSHKLFDTVLDDMPSELTQNLPEDIKFETVKINKVIINTCGKIPAGFIYAAYSKKSHTVQLASSISSSYKVCPVKLELVIKKKIAHELFHAYDFNKKSTIDKIKGCSRTTRRNENGKRLKSKKLCEKLKKHNRRSAYITEDIRFKNIAQLHGKGKGDFKGVRVLNPYEIKNSYEFSATNFEAFVYDKEYQCRRPTLYSFFSEKFNSKPNSSYNCNSINFVIPESGINNKINIDPSRIYQIHYLQASAGKALMSRFGHSMIRFVVCAPERIDRITSQVIPATEYGEACLADLDYHFVASFRAKVAESSLDNWGGIVGKYPSTMYIVPLKEVMKEYNTLEFRNLTSYKLQLNYEEKQKLIKRTLETFWEYSGSYKFITNNCANETYKLIIGVKGDLKAHLRSSLTPDGILGDMIKNKIITSEIVDENYKQPFYFFKSREGYFKIVMKNLLNKKLVSGKLEDYLGRNPNERRLTIERALQKINTGTVDDSITKKIANKLISSFIVLENHAYILSIQKYKAKQSTTLYNLNESTDQEKLDMLKELSQSHHLLLQSTYGIPSSNEAKALEANIHTTDESKYTELLKEIFVGELLEEEAEVTENANNIKILLNAKNKHKTRRKR